MATGRKKTKEEEEIERKRKRREKQVRDAKERGDKEFDKTIEYNKAFRTANPGGYSESEIQAVDSWKEWDNNPDGSQSRWALRADNVPGRNLVQIQTPSGGYITAKGEDIGYNFNESMRRDREKAQRLADARAKGREIRDRLDEEQANQLAGQLREKGINIEPRKADGSFDATKAKGLLASATFQEWEDDKLLAKQGEEARKATRKELRYWNQAQDGRLGLAAQRDAIQNQNRIEQLRNDIAAGESDPGGLDGPGFWRGVAEGKYNAAVRTQQAAANMEELANLNNKSATELSKLFGVSFETISSMLEGGLSIEELAELDRRRKESEVEV